MHENAQPSKFSLGGCAPETAKIMMLVFLKSRLQPWWKAIIIFTPLPCTITEFIHNTSVSVMDHVRWWSNLQDSQHFHSDTVLLVIMFASKQAKVGQLAVT